MPGLSIDEAKDLLRSVYDNSRDQIIPCLIGEPGIGKSQAVYELAKEKGVNVVEIIASQILPNEVSGITMPVDKTHSMEIYDHIKLSSLKEGDILFFDELLQAAPQTLAACLTLLQERKLLSGKKLPDVMIVAACNPLASAEQTPLSIRQRFMFVDVSFSRCRWIDYMIAKDFDKELIEAVSESITFDRKGCYNVPTPRTVEKLLTWITRAKSHEEEDIILNYIQNNISASLYSTLGNYLEDKNKREQEDAMIAKVIEIACKNEEDSTERDDLEAIAAEGIDKLIEYLQKLEDWDTISKELAEVQVEEIDIPY